VQASVVRARVHAHPPARAEGGGGRDGVGYWWAAGGARLVVLGDAQYEAGEGPCLAVLEPHDPISLDDAGEVDDRWEHFAGTAQQLGVHSTLSMHLPVDSGGGLAASLNLYSRRHME
jgi:hypothetical protein